MNFVVVFELTRSFRLSLVVSYTAATRKEFIRWNPAIPNFVRLRNK